MSSPDSIDQLWQIRESMVQLREDALQRGFTLLALTYSTSLLNLGWEVTFSISMERDDG